MVLNSPFTFSNPFSCSVWFAGSPPSPAISYSNLEYSIETTITPVFSTLGKQFRVVTNDTVVLPCEVVNAGKDDIILIDWQSITLSMSATGNRGLQCYSMLGDRSMQVRLFLFEMDPKKIFGLCLVPIQGEFILAQRRKNDVF